MALYENEDIYGDDEFDTDLLGDDEDEDDDLYGDDEDDDFGDEEIILGDDEDILSEAVEEFGASGRISKRRVQALIRRRNKLLALMPVVSEGRQKRLRRRVLRINKLLTKAGYGKAARRNSDEMAASGLEGVGGLHFTVNSPPGLGRLVRLPFYPSASPVPATIITSAGAATVSATNPIIYTSQLNTFAGGTAYTMNTPQISWAMLRIVGFETTQLRQANLVGNNTGGAATDDGEVGPAIIVQDLQIGGGANLFTHEDYGDATIYDANQPEFAGLRDYPVLKSPNTASVNMNQVGVIDANGRYRVTFSASLLCEVLIDDQYGAHIPGAYARRGALVRQGSSFV